MKIKIKHIIFNPCFILSILILVFLLTPISFAKKEQFDKNTKLVVRDSSGKQVGLLVDFAPAPLILLKINGLKVLLKTPDFGELNPSVIPLHGTIDTPGILDAGGSVGDLFESMPTAILIYEDDNCTGQPFLTPLASPELNIERLGLNYVSIGPPGLDPEAGDLRSIYISPGGIDGYIDIESKRTWNLENGFLGECEQESVSGLPTQSFEEVDIIPNFVPPFSIDFE